MGLDGREGDHHLGEICSGMRLGGRGFSFDFAMLLLIFLCYLTYLRHERLLFLLAWKGRKKAWLDASTPSKARYSPSRRSTFERPSSPSLPHPFPFPFVHHASSQTRRFVFIVRF